VGDSRPLTDQRGSIIITGRRVIPRPSVGEDRQAHKETQDLSVPLQSSSVG
jgi:hypothetical protein